MKLLLLLDGVISVASVRDVVLLVFPGPMTGCNEGRDPDAAERCRGELDNGVDVAGPVTNRGRGMSHLAHRGR